MIIQKIRHVLVPMLTLSVMMTTMAHAKITNLDPPGDREFVADTAHMLDAQTIEEIKSIGDQLLTDTAIPIIVVTINSMASHGGSNMRIETFARTLFDQWGIGHPEINSSSWNRGILLVVSQGDRKARIELGADWGYEFDPICQRIMDEQIIPNFKEGNFSGGVLAGVIGLEHMARGLELPPPVRPKWLFPAIIVSIALFIFTVISLIRRGSSGWAWVFWAIIFGILGFLLISALRSSSSTRELSNSS